MKKNLPLFRNFLFIFLFLAAFLERSAFDLGPNIELVTTALILSSFYLGKKSSFTLIFLIMLFSDLVLGNNKIFFFTWTGFLIPAALSTKLIKTFTSLLRLKLKLVTPFSLTFSGIAANLFFYFWTNFGVWYLDSWGMYNKNWQGLLKCYLYGLPFLKNQVLSSLIFIPCFFFLVEFFKRVLSFFFIKVRASSYQKISYNNR